MNHSPPVINMQLRSAAILASLLLTALPARQQAAAETVSVIAPAGHLRAAVGVDDKLGLFISVTAGNTTILAPSPLGLELNGQQIGPDLAVSAVTHSQSDQTWRPVCHERAEIRDHYHQAVLTLERQQPPHLQMQLVVRAYDTGIAFQYRFPQQPHLQELHITTESSEFRFTGNHTAWAAYSGQGTYQDVPISELRPGCERPLVIQINETTFAAIAEAALVDYARMRLAPAKTAPNAIVSQLHGDVTLTTPAATPWRVVMVGNSPGELLENNDIILNLNPACAIADTSWIRPGKVIREVTLTTAGGLACVDFAAKHGLQYVEFDAGWYGPEGDPNSDATTVTLDPQRSAGPLDLHAVIEYAKQRNIGVILYVNRRALEQQLDQLLPLYRDWGVAGIKFGFVQVGSQQWTRWLHDAIAKCAQYQLMVDVHDEYRPTGFSRTYPNLMTVEGIGGDETQPTHAHTLHNLFTRMIAGPADNTFCWTDPRVTRNGTHAAQLAKAICIFSPWQFLFWYDRPATVHETDELALLQHLPTVWDDTRVLHGEIGAYAVIARRSRETWYVGALNAETERECRLTLDFLEPDTTYLATLYQHDPDSSSPTKVGIRTQPVTHATIIDLQLPTNDGAAIHITPVESAAASLGLTPK